MGKKIKSKSSAKSTKKTSSKRTTDVEPLSEYVCQRIKHLRKRKNWTLEQLAARSGVSRSMLSQVERGAANPTLAIAFRIAQALDVSLADLVDGANEQRVIVIRRNDDQSLYRDDRICRVRTLSPLNLEKDVEFYEVTLHSGQRLDSAAHFQGTREFLTVQSGSIQVTSGDQTVELRKGDSVQYKADVDHSILNTGKSSAVVFLVDIYRGE